MAFRRIDGVEGLLYVPEENCAPKKHPCRDCFRCQWCSDNRCTLCRGPEGSGQAGRPTAQDMDRNGQCATSMDPKPHKVP
jgi:hypothetical protein